MTQVDRRGSPAAPPFSQTLHRHKESEEARRRIYMGIHAIGMVVQTTNWSLNLLRPEPDLVTMFSNPVFFVMSAWSLYWLYTRHSDMVIYTVALIVCGLVILARSVVTPLIGGPAMLESLSDLYWLLVVISIVSFLMLGYRRAIAMTAVFYLMSVAVPWGVLALSSAPFAQAARLGQVQLLCAIVLTTLCSLAWYREHFMMERHALVLTEKASRTDPLTGLNNRHALYPMLEAVIGTVGGDAPAALLLLDIDHFKGVNDRLGHTAGDEVLRNVAQTLRQNLRENDVLGRWGGEEFLIALSGIETANALAVAERLRVAVAQQPAQPGQQVTISVGVTLLISGESLQACVSRADGALYLAKDAGRNRVELAVTRTDPDGDDFFSSEYQEGAAPSPA